MRPVAGDLIRHLAAVHGDATLALLGEEQLTYRQAEQRSAALAKGMLATGAGKGTRVGLLAPNGPDWIVTWLAASRIGALLVPLSTYSPPRQLAWTLRHADVANLVVSAAHLEHDHLERLASAVEGLVAQPAEQIRTSSHPYLRAVWVLGEAERTFARPVAELVARGADIGDDLLEAVEAQVTPADPMVLVYSSGSTADPKGAIHTHGAAIRHGMRLGEFRVLRAGDRIYTPMPLFWIGGFSYALIRAMHAGATLVFEERFEPAATLELLERERVTHVLGWPHMGPALTQHPDRAHRDLSSLRGGSLPDLLPPERRPADPGLVPGSLGMTETLGPHSIDFEGVELGEDKRGSFGRAVPALEHQVVDPETGRALAAGEPGELCVRGESVMLGLYKRERSEVFTPDGWYRTGDGGWLDADGHFFFTGRLGQMIKSGGRNVAPAQVEQVLEEQKEVRRAIVVGVPSEARGEDVAAAVVVEPDAAVTADDLQERLRADLAAYEVPRHMVLLDDDAELPWLDSGKVDRRALASRLAATISAGD